MAPGSVLLSTVVGVTLATGGFAIGLGTTGIADGSTSFWYLSRASGFVAYLLLWGSVVWGLLLSTGTGRRWMRPPRLMVAPACSPDSRCQLQDDDAEYSHGGGKVSAVSVARRILPVSATRVR